MRYGLYLLAGLAGLLLCGCSSTSNLDVVSGFEIDRYLGTWYEVARFPHRFERGLTSVTAEYSLNPDGTVRVVNRGYNTAKAEWEQAVAEAKFKNDPTKGWLKVSFFKPFYASYKIIHLDAEYTEAIVTGPTYSYLWILVRDPDISQPDLDRLVRTAGGFGFDTNRLELIEHTVQP
jgi:apolipoprotein D and lipocalin family protein